MKKEIYCVKCKLRVVGALEKTRLQPGERVKYVDGVSTKHTICNFCNMEIFPGQACCCFSNYFDEIMPYVPWEDEFITPDGAEEIVPPEPMGVYRLLITGDNDQIIRFSVPLAMILNFLERRMNTVFAMCMSESLELAKGMAKKLNLTLQYIDYVDGVETYPLLNKGTHAQWQRGGYKEDG